MRIHICAQILD